MIPIAFVLAVAAAPTPYPVPSPLPAGTNGSIVWQLPAQGADALPHAASNTLVLYRPTALDGTTVAVSGVVSVPQGTPPPGGWPLISWAHGTTGDAPECAPSHEDASDEQRLLDAFVAHGYAVAQTDYEGEGTPGIHPYFVGEASARDVTDMARAARNLDAHIGTRWIAMGHSEGGTGAIFTAARGTAWAPDMQLLGAVSYAPASHITSYFSSVAMGYDATANAPLFAMMVQAMAAVPPVIDLDSLVTHRAAELIGQLQKRCVGDLLEDPYYSTIPPGWFFSPHANLQPLYERFLANEPGRLAAIGVPLLLMQGANDQMVSPTMTGQLAHELCALGTNLDYRTVAYAEHDTVMTMSAGDVAAWLADRFAEKPANRACK